MDFHDPYDSQDGNEGVAIVGLAMVVYLLVGAFLAWLSGGNAVLWILFWPIMAVVAIARLIV